MNFFFSISNRIFLHHSDSSLDDVTLFFECRAVDELCRVSVRNVALHQCLRDSVLFIYKDGHKNRLFWRKCFKCGFFKWIKKRQNSKKNWLKSKLLWKAVNLSSRFFGNWQILSKIRNFLKCVPKFTCIIEVHEKRQEFALVVYHPASQGRVVPQVPFLVYGSSGQNTFVPASTDTLTDQHHWSHLAGLKYL